MPGHRVEASRLVAVEPTVAFDRLMAARPPEVFTRGYAAFPAVREATEEPHDWGTVGQTRTIHLADGGRLRQTITSVDRPHSYAYLLDDIHGRLRPFVRSVDGAQAGPAVLVALNLTSVERDVAIGRGAGRVLEATHPDRFASTVDTAVLRLRPDEGVVVELEGS